MELVHKIIKKFKKPSELWPEPDYEKDNEPHFLFILTPPYSGSTAIANLLNTSKRTASLQAKAEGQWLIPGLCQNDRWEKGKYINYNSVKSVWLNRYQELNRSEKVIDVVIEKSPPNMMRIMELSSRFKSFSFVANNRNPYANCASILYRHHNDENIGAEQRIKVLSSIARDWIKRSFIINKLVTEHEIPLITYEDFCKNPATLIKELNLPRGVVDTIDVNAIVKVKDYEPQKILNQNDRQISKLTAEELQHLTNIFIEKKELLDNFGYKLLQP